MPVVQPRHVLSGMLVNEAMRRQIVQLPAAAAIAKGINHLLKFKVNALLITDADQRPAGVVSKTDLIAAFYAGLPIDTPLGDIMIGPPLACYPDDAIESALDRMRSHGVHRLYVTGAEATSMVGTLSYTDVVALLYRYCRSCPKSTSRKGLAGKPEDEEWRLHVKDVMTASVVSFPESARIAQVVEGLMAHRFGAVLIGSVQGAAMGVISKTDLIRAYHHGVSLEATADSIMTAPVVTWDQDALLWEALQYMFLKDVQRLFVHSGDPLRIIGVLSLSDTARVRSGSCRACTPSRFITAE
ncbi:MAG: CBS domain-containing protein [Desulfobacterales bacterium]|jgi:signal-transduction protein with cAMP-binding, CBS, and nucleotidyltransferase domain|nr:CBS domain-containing protein [Desulfobacterales bacterium]